MYNFFIFLFGYVKIEISGKDIEKLLNITAKRKIRISNLHYANLKVTGNIAPSDFPKLKGLRKDLEVRIKILKKSGIIFKIKPHLGRVGFIAGFFMFLIILKSLSLFVWGIDIKGNKTVDKNEILSVANSLGIKNGCLQSSLDSKTLADKILLKIPKLTWSSVNIEGCYVTINVSEAENTEEYRQKPPSNLIASSDGVIKKIKTVSGETVVSIGDSVAKGDVLVSGIIEMKGSRAFVNSSGQIYAETIKTYKRSENFKVEVYKPKTRKTRKGITFLWFKIPLYLGTVKEPYRVKYKENRIKFLGKDMPVTVNTADFTILEKKKVTYKKDVLKKILLKQIEADIEKNVKGKYKTVSTVVCETNTALTVTKVIKTTENIARQSIINLD